VEETSAFRIFERKAARKIHAPVKEGEHRKIRTDKEKKDILRRTDTLKFIKSSPPPTKMVWSC
jgi:hypothetical protein